MLEERRAYPRPRDATFAAPQPVLHVHRMLSRAAAVYDRGPGPHSVARGCLTMPRRDLASMPPSERGRRSPRAGATGARPRAPSRITSRRTHARPAPVADRPHSGPPAAADDGLERLQKVLASAGLGSRRSCEELITTGRVEVDRQVVTQLGVRVDPHAQEIRVDGERLPHPKRVVFMLNKPVGVVTTNYDPSGRPRVVDLVPGEQRLFAIGRLDRMSEGLILLTNDGGLANLLAHPRYGVEKKYLVQVAGVPTEELLDRLRRGIRLAEGEVHAKRVSVKSQHKQSAVLEMVLDEGKNREIRRMLARLGHKVHQLKRVAVGTLSLGNLLPGQWRQLPWSEIESLRRDALAAVGPSAERTPPRRGDRDERPRRPLRRGPPKRRRPGKASTWRKPRGET
jgi:23S rRNA pseudouridine2605 synthase